MRKKTFAVTALFAASYISVSGLFKIILSFTDGSIHNYRPTYYPLHLSRQLFPVVFGLSVLFLILTKTNHKLDRIYKNTTWTCLFLAIPRLYTDTMLFMSQFQAVYIDSYLNSQVKMIYLSILSCFLNLLLSVLIALYCALSLYKIKKHKKKLSIAVICIGALMLISLFYFWYIAGYNRYFDMFVSILTIVFQTCMLIYGFMKVEDEGISINRQTGFIIASIISVLICIKADPAETMTNLYILFPIIVSCLVNVVADLIIGKKYKDENNSIVYTKEIKTIICAVSLIISCIIMVCIMLSLPKGDWGGLIILPVMAVYLVSNIFYAPVK